MARRTFSIADVAEMLICWDAGRSLSETSEKLGMDRKTLRKYIAAVARAGITPGSTPARGMREWTELARELFPQLADARLRQVTRPAIARHHDYIAAQLTSGVRASAIHQRLRDEHGLTASIASFRRYVAANIAPRDRQDAAHGPRPAATVRPSAQR